MFALRSSKSIAVSARGRAFCCAFRHWCSHRKASARSVSWRRWSRATSKACGLWCNTDSTSCGVKPALQSATAALCSARDRSPLCSPSARKSRAAGGSSMVSSAGVLCSSSRSGIGGRSARATAAAVTRPKVPRRPSMSDVATVRMSGGVPRRGRPVAVRNRGDEPPYTSMPTSWLFQSAPSMSPWAKMRRPRPEGEISV